MERQGAADKLVLPGPEGVCRQVHSRDKRECINSQLDHSTQQSTGH